MSETAIVSIAVALITGIIAAIPPTIFALKAVAVGKEAVTESKKTTEKTDVIIEKATEIHAVSNGHLSKVTAALEVANDKMAGMADKVTGLEKLIDAMSKQMIPEVQAVLQGLKTANGKLDHIEEQKGDS